MKCQQQQLWKITLIKSSLHIVKLGDNEKELASYCETCGQFQNDYPTLQCTKCGDDTVEKVME